MNTRSSGDNGKPQLTSRIQSAGSGPRHRKKKSRNRCPKGRRLHRGDTILTEGDQVDGVARKIGHLEKRLDAMKEWRIWQALVYLFGWLFKSKEDVLKDEELKLLQRFTSTSCWSQFIPISNRVEVRTLKFDLGFTRNSPAIVLLHGFSSGLGVWSPCFDFLCQKCPVYALDLPGFGRSSRVPFLGNEHDIEYQYVCYIDEWRDAVGLENFILVGHGFGGYLATLYALRHPERTRHLVLVEPWGFTELPFGLVRKRRSSCFQDSSNTYREQLPWLARRANDVLNFFHPLYLLRIVPSFLGKWIVRALLCSSLDSMSRCDNVSVNQEHRSTDHRVRSAKELCFSSKNYLWDCDHSYRYLYQCNLLRPTGIEAFAKLNLFYFWSASPLVYKIQNMDPNVPISFIYGGNSAVDHKTGYEVYHLLPQSFVEVYMINDAGHNIFIDNPEKFCDILLSIVDSSTHRQRSPSESSEGVSYDYDDLYWDSAWETLRLSRQNLFFPEEDQEEVDDVLSEDWEMDSYEFSCEEAPEKRYFLAPQISGIDASKSDTLVNDSKETVIDEVGVKFYQPDENNDGKVYFQDFVDLR